MDLLNFLMGDPVIAWFAFLALMLIVVSVASVLWRRTHGRSRDDVAKQPAQVTKDTRFGIQGDLIVLLLGLVLLLSVIDWIRSTFFGVIRQA